MDQLKDRELPKTYDPHAVEEPLYQWWEENGYFKPETQVAAGQSSWDAPTFTIGMPPPNVTGALHIGHAMTATVEDIMTRYHRMRGDLTLWVPGSDHAGIATQAVVERRLADEGLTRHDLGREKFVARVWQWKELYHRRITDQHRRLGVSVDWERERFTMDEGLSRAVLTAFIRLYNKGLIYRGDYLVNWCPRCLSVISDLEVLHHEEQGALWYVRYPLVPEGHELSDAPWGSADWGKGATEWITVATTRPETILGDTAVAVHPGDEGYAGLVGRVALLPGVSRPIPIIADAAVEREFGTGAVKVTPGHDPTDYAIGQRHGLPIISIMNRDATINQEGGPYAGLDRYEARRRLVDDLEAAGLLVKKAEHTLSVGHCQRCGTVIEPLISTQWFVRMKPLAEPAVAAVRDGRIRIVPDHFEKIYFHWMENVRDWVISRQLWWGHRIPVWYGPDDHSFAAFDATEAHGLARQHYGHDVELRQDDDVLDTWFSSGLWPFSILGWPDDTSDLRTFYPNSVLETGYDIIFFWVARMIFMGLEMMGDIPFHTVYLHGLIRDELGRKYSKSLGNALDPMAVIEDVGTDALRFTLMTSSTPGVDTKLSEKALVAGRNFMNKLWNIARFTLSSLPDDTPPLDPQRLTLPDRWILSRLDDLTESVTRLFEAYQFGEAGRQIRDFLWDEFADWYVEMSKIRLQGSDAAAKATAQAVLATTLERALRLLHPFAPFITETLWQRLPHDGPTIMLAPWPTPAGWRDETAEREMDLVRELIRAIRNARSEYNVEPARRIAAIVSAAAHESLLQAQAPIIEMLARVDPAQLSITPSLAAAPAQAVSLVIGDGIVAYLPLAGLIDVAKERERLGKEMADTEAEIERTTTLLGKPGFADKAPANVVQSARDKLAAAEARRQQLGERLAQLA
ncbi:MAG: valine--tRNA ligase [Anaerolineae bacterium]